DPAWRKVKQAEIPWEWHPQLARHATQLGITVFSSPFEERAVDVLEAAGTPAYKIASYEINHLPLIRYAAHTGKPLLISTGMASLGDIERALDAAADAGGRDLLLMHCVATYPPSFDELNLRAIGTLRDAFQLPIGWSDHTLGHTADVVAVSLGACAVEKHFTLSRQQDGPDHPFALEPHELQAMVVAIRQAEAALGSTVKRMTDDATDEYRRGRRSLMAARDVAAGRVIVRDDVAVKRPGSGIAVYHLDQVVGSRAARDLARDQSLRWDDLIH
ncbi:MAG: N-acetylneuraminate synthase family protein, partial [Pseudonocardiaceae bacterium]